MPQKAIFYSVATKINFEHDFHQVLVFPLIVASDNNKN